MPSSRGSLSMNNKGIWILLIIIFFLAGAAGSFFISRKLAMTDKPSVSVTDKDVPAEAEDFLSLKIYYPINNTLTVIEKKVPRRTKQFSTAEALIEEYFKGPGDGKEALIPLSVKLLGLYRDSNQILYIDLTDEFRRNFHGDALSEYLLLKSIYESLISNLPDFQDFKLLVEGKEIETFGGHFYLKYPLKNSVSQEIKAGVKTANE